MYQIKWNGMEIKPSFYLIKIPLIHFYLFIIINLLLLIINYLFIFYNLLLLILFYYFICLFLLL